MLHARSQFTVILVGALIAWLLPCGQTHARAKNDLGFNIGAGAGFTLALVLMAGLREKLALAAIPDMVRGTALTLALAGFLSLAFMGFAGLGG